MSVTSVSETSKPVGPTGAPTTVPTTADMRWNGWGDPALAKDLPLAVRALLPMKLGRVPKAAPAANLEDVVLEASALSDEDLAALAAVVGGEHVIATNEARMIRLWWRIESRGVSTVSRSPL